VLAPSLRLQPQENPMFATRYRTQKVGEVDVFYREAGPPDGPVILLLLGFPASNHICIVEQDHRAVKRIARPMLGFKSFRCASILIAGIETMHMIRKGQLDCPEGQALSAAIQFYSLAV
jgi:hypothetical protein